VGSLANKANPSVGLDPTIPGWADQVGTMLNNLLIGKLNNTGTVTLAAGAASTTVSDARCGPLSVINVMATGAIPVGHWSIQTRTNGSFTITRTSTTGTCTVAYALLG
jgi:hypothetical protein